MWLPMPGGSDIGFHKLYISLFLNKPMEYIGIENYKIIYKYIQLQRNRNGHSD